MTLSRPAMTRLKTTTRTVFAAAATIALVTAPATAFAADPAKPRPPKIKVLDTSVKAPFQITYGRKTLLVSDGAASTVSKLSSKKLYELFKTPEGLSALAMNSRGDVAYGIQQGDAENGGPTTRAELVIKGKKQTHTADLLAYDKTSNPDQAVSYGIDNPTPCQEAAFAAWGGAKYNGGVDSHPYAVAALDKTSWVVADAGGNDLLKVDEKGKVSTLAVLPRQASTITQEGADALGLPACVVGAVYHFESVPTDVEVTKTGLLVSLLPGGPEDPSLGARGSVVHVDWQGQVTTVAGGFLGATNLAVDPKGSIYVAEMFAGRISKVENGKVSKYVDLPNALSLQFAHGNLYAGTLASPSGPGSIVSIR
ncbi:ScyD/ScyE family protein [Kineosporia rhizophila]|uniref:ScyD/ScyE family protein n=1 Tax=Kineosporia rhizophila TaxID=84633 RepID=UPI001E43330C|nr:ScyD/ScyE family protein [Kineosporia rhizophila]MCE0538154.1 ScyD/ScyE family protein [Kineosporia rhizophila]